MDTLRELLTKYLTLRSLWRTGTKLDISICSSDGASESDLEIIAHEIRVKPRLSPDDHLICGGHNSPAHTVTLAADTANVDFSSSLQQLTAPAVSVVASFLSVHACWTTLTLPRHGAIAVDMA